MVYSLLPVYMYGYFFSKYLIAEFFKIWKEKETE